MTTIIRTLSFKKPISGEQLLHIFDKLMEIKHPNFRACRKKFSETSQLWIEIRRGQHVKELTVTLSTSPAPLLVYPRVTYQELALRCDVDKTTNEWRKVLEQIAAAFVDQFNQQIKLIAES